MGATTNLFRVLGVRRIHGRDFIDEDGMPPPAPPPQVAGAAAAPLPPPLITILSHDFWQRRFGGDPAVVGSTIRVGVNGRAEIVGVLPPGFELLLPPRTGFDPTVDMWTALRLNFDTAARNNGALRVIGRIKPGVSTEQAQEDAARAIPGVVSVASASSIPLDGSTNNIPYAPIETGSADPSAFRQASTRFVTPGYFETLGTRLVAGRTYTDDDNKTDRPARIIIDEILARQVYPEGSAVGRILLLRNLNPGPNEPPNLPFEIIGVVAHQRHESLASPGREGVFYVDAVSGVGALVMAAVGLYGLLSTTVRMRTPELGMRMVCGADRVVASGAALIPARRAALLDPVVTIREDL